MGRSVYFSTSLSYQFARHVQPSSDITEFGGDGDEEEGTWRWSAADAAVCLKKIRQLEEENGWSQLDFTKWDQTEEGTGDMMVYLYALEIDEEVKYLYMLGCLIYQQLRWCPELSCSYEE